MIIECEKCGTKFNLDESLLEAKGSNVRCSKCKHVFIAYPEPSFFTEEAQTVAVSQSELEDTFGQGLQPAVDEELDGDGLEDDEIDFDNIFEESLEDIEELNDESYSGEQAVIEEDVKAPQKETDHGLSDQGNLPPTEELFEDELLEETEITLEESPKKRSGLSRFFLVFLVLVLFVLGTAAAVFLWAPEWIPDSLSILKPAEKQKNMDIGVRRLSFKDVDGFFVDSKTSGHLFVIKGKVKSEYLDRRSFILVKGTILDDKGQVVESKMAYAGTNFSEEEIKTLPMQEITSAMKNRYGVGKKNVNVPSGTTIPFTVVFKDLPKNLGEFTVEAVSSSPGT